MEIAQDIIEKVMFQYFSQPILICFNIEGNPVIEKFDYNSLKPDFENKRDLLILKSLSSITDEDARMAAKINGAVFSENAKVYFSTANFYGIWIENDRSVKNRFIMWDQLMLSVFQFLQSKGYDLPQYLLGGKTLKEAGLAIYESEIK